jgi:amino acid adenylation domain-containing protein
MPFLLHQLLTRAAESDAGREAVRCANTSLTYGQLESSANAVAHGLLQAGIERGDRIGILLPKSTEAVACLYGSLKAGAAYVPMDPKAPVARTAAVANDCRVSAIITTPALASRFLPLLDTRPSLVVLIGDDAPLQAPHVTYTGVINDQPAHDPDIPGIDADLAYILYTSGSTGRPKGVMLSHRNALTFVEWCAESIGVDSSDRLSNHAPFHFDLSVFDLYLAAFGTATVVLVPEDIAYFGQSLTRFIVDERITIWYSVPSALRLITKTVDGPGTFPLLRTVAFAGEVYPTPHLRKLKRIVPDAALWNLYGPTETNVCTYYRVDELPEDGRPIPIGRACRNTDVFAVAPDGTVAGVGEEGELFVRGATVMRGYWGQPERTAEALVPNPVDETRPDLVYRTGDRVRLQPSGDYEFLGRLDHQIKSRGYRIELGEIEAALTAHESLQEAAVLGIPHDEWGTAIVAWVVPRQDAEPTEVDIKRHVADRLPRYMVPERVVIATELPKTSTGKIDRVSMREQFSNTRQTT